MTKLVDIVKIKHNDINSITLEVEPDKTVDLINLGFDPKLKYIFLSKGSNHTMKLINEDLDCESFDFGKSGYTLISENLKSQKEKVLDCITDDFGIAYDGNPQQLEKTSLIKNKTDKDGMKFLISLFWFDDDNHVSMHRDNFYFKSFSSLDKANQYVYDNYDVYHKFDLRLSDMTGCNILEYKVYGKSKDKEQDIDMDLG